ncbi:MAG TPA: cupin domain-containing protein [Tepidisphaeraceae bacterium]|nr:cupin domain-containing protein [Tepidisphaeraceae bacterium]
MQYRDACAVPSLAVLLCLLTTGCQSNCPHGSDQAHRAITPDQIQWQNNPPSLPPGAKMAVLEGDPSKPGFFTIRAVFPDGFRIPPHMHPNAERVTVLSGTLYLAHGEKFDESAAQALPAGSYSSMPAGMHHYGFAKGETTIQVSSIGPWGITYLNPSDDPRKPVK